jgi:predicted PurR-regulated permease PerM
VSRLGPHRSAERRPVVDDPPDAVGPAEWSLPRGVIVLLGLAATVVAVAGMKAFAAVLGPVVLALTMTVTAGPMIGWLRRRGWPTWAGIAATVVTVYLVLTVFAASVAVSVARLTTLLPTYQDQLDRLVDDVRAALGAVGVGPDQVQQRLHEVDVGGLVGGFLSGLTAALSNVVLILALVLFMCLDAAGLPARLHVARTERPTIVDALETFARGTRRYLLLSTVFGLIVAVLDTVALWWMGIPLPVLWGLLSFITNFIPNVGFLVGLVPPAVLGLLEGGPKLMLAVIAVYSIVNFMIQSVIQPKVVGDAVGLSTTVTLLSLVFWTWVLGPLGAVLAIPLSLLAKGLLIDIDPATRWIDVVISSGPVRGASRPDPTPVVSPDPDDARLLSTTDD